MPGPCRAIDDPRRTGGFHRLGGGGDLVGSDPFPVLTYDATLGGRVDVNK